jgi:hypothetical protein
MEKITVTTYRGLSQVSGSISLPKLFEHMRGQSPENPGGTNVGRHRESRPDEEATALPHRHSHLQQ